jgi:hypothetical protein
MSELVELVFEAITPQKAREVIDQIQARSPTRLIVHADDAEATWAKISQEDCVGNFANLWSTVPLLLIDDSYPIREVGLRCFRYDSRYDVELNVDIRSLSDPSRFASSLHTFACEVAARCGIYNFYAGLDPGHDPETRLFTGHRPGPLFGHRAGTC